MSESETKEEVIKNIKKSDKNEDEKEEIKIDNKQKTKSRSNKTIDTTLFEQEMKSDCVKKGKPVKTATNDVKKVKTLVKRYNEKGERITKKGTVDRRAEIGRERFRKYKEIIEERKASNPVVKTPYVESDDSDEDNIEFTIETINELESAPIVPVKPTPVKINPYLEEEREKLKKAHDDMLKLQEENKKLKESVFLNSHLQTLDKMSRQVKLKF